MNEIYINTKLEISSTDGTAMLMRDGSAGQSYSHKSSTEI